MSKGYGTTQRAVLDKLADGRWWSVIELAASLSGDARPTRAAVESVRRAARRLSDAGLVELEYVRYGDDGALRTWSSIGGERDYYAGTIPVSWYCWRLAARKR